MDAEEFESHLQIDIESVPEAKIVIRGEESVVVVNDCYYEKSDIMKMTNVTKKWKIYWKMLTEKEFRLKMMKKMLDEREDKDLTIKSMDTRLSDIIEFLYEKLQSIKKIYLW